MGAADDARRKMRRARAKKAFRLALRPAFWRAARAGVAASVEHLDVPFDPAIRSVLDVGASRGQFALLSADLFPSSRIICFEPLPESRASIGRVLGDRVEVIAAAVGDESGEAALNVSAKEDSSSLLPIGDRQVREFPGTGSNGTLQVEVTTLDRAVSPGLERPCLLKIDVQGSELAVLRGAEQTLDQVDEALIECSFVELYGGQPLADEVIGYMRRSGFRLRGVHGISYANDGSAVQADFFFHRGSDAGDAADGSGKAL